MVDLHPLQHQSKASVENKEPFKNHAFTFIICFIINLFTSC